MLKSVTHRVPATSANLGPGYDCLGVALRIYNRVTVSRGEPKEALPSMVAKAGSRFFETAEMRPFPFDWAIGGDVPQSRGLGSSVTVRLGVLHGLNELTDGPLDREELFVLCSELEGHPDNAAPGEFGGFTVASMDGCISFDVSPDLSFVLLIPEFEILTDDARRVLPSDMKHDLAAASAGNAARITAAFASGQYEALRGAFEDYLHQPFRQPLMPFMPEVIRAGEKAGALGGFLSGSGSAIACVTLENPEKVAAAMKEASGVAARTVITTTDKQGIKKVKS
ncbi:MAG: homoserine kinase [Chthoniobacteraceae bacterium]